MKVAIKFLSLTPIEAEAYERNPRIQRSVDMVAHMVQDLHEEDADVSIVLALNDADNENEFSLAFSGSTLSLEIYDDRVEVVDFNDGDDIVLKSYEPNQLNAATTWLVNQIRD